MAKRRKLVIGLLIAACAVAAVPSAVWRVRRHYLLEDLFGADQVRSSAAVNQFARHANRSTTEYLLAAPRTSAEYDRTARVFRATGPKGIEQLRRLAMEPWKRPPKWAPDWLAELMMRRGGGPSLATLMLGEVGPSGIPVLVEIGANSACDSWADAISKLAEVDDQEAIPALEAVVGGNSTVDGAVVCALSEMRVAAATQALERIRGTALGRTAAMAAMKLAMTATEPERTELLLDALERGDTRTVPEAAIKLAWRDDARVTPALVAALERHAGRCGKAGSGLPSIILTLGKRAGGEDSLGGFLKHSNMQVGLAAAYALAERHDQRGLEVLRAHVLSGAYASWLFAMMPDVQACDVSALGLEMCGGTEGQAIVERARAAGMFVRRKPRGAPSEPPTVKAVARRYREFMTGRGTPHSAILLLALERHGTPQMAADFIASGSRPLAIGAAEWAWRHGKREEVKALLPEGDCRSIVDDPALLYTTPGRGWTCEVEGCL